MRSAESLLHPTPDRRPSPPLTRARRALAGARRAGPRAAPLALALLLGLPGPTLARSQRAAPPAVADAGARGSDLWTELPARARRPLALPSLAPLVDQVGGASLVLFTEFDPESAPSSSPHAALPEGHPPVPGFEGAPDFGDPGAGGQGSGFVIHPSGLVLTNYHVIEGARAIFAWVGRGTDEVPARVVGTDPKTDVALLELVSERRDWPALPLGDSDALRVGDFLVAIGSPFGLDRSVSLGILSARGRRDIWPGGRAGLYDFLQTDASINLGNSGGPLLNLAGEVVGMNTAINADGQGIGFAIPVNMIKKMLPALRSEGRLVRAWMGVGIQPVSPDLARAFGLEHATGALIREVVPGSPAALAGMRHGDVVLRFGAQEVIEADDLPLLASDAKVGDRVEVSGVRQGQPMRARITLAAHPDNLPPRDAPSHEPLLAAPEPGTQRGAELGLKVTTLLPDDRQRLAIEESVRGARVLDVRLGSPAFQAGLLPDDVVREVNHEPVDTAHAFAAQVQRARAGEALRLWVWRADGSFFVALDKP